MIGILIKRENWDRDRQGEHRGKTSCEDKGKPQNRKIFRKSSEDIQEALDNIFFL